MEAELGYYECIDQGLTYYQGCLEQAIEGQAKAREAVQALHRERRLVGSDDVQEAYGGPRSAGSEQGREAGE